ncbi:glycosyltransferase family 2 protein [Natronosalvus caseinilyticus]|uniref:glycosyltransferase family 2 protein n=1 Tax=Natronosalvus caseinilyticus TaxID=2953747 RepID=UPI0028B25937|nr:glycosyltransferase family 2 protein [Natronosalvus caseinilyticus]
MYRDHSVAAVVPAYNEERFIGDVIRKMPSFVDRLYVVNDCSTDGTWEAILEAARSDARRQINREGAVTDRVERIRPDGGENPALAARATVHEPIGRVVPIDHRENRGAGGAIKTGYLAARAGRLDIVVTVDGDGQMDLEVMPKLLDPIVDGVADYAKGNRLLAPDHQRSMPRFRLCGNALLSLLTKIASGYWKLSDPQNGYTAISRDALEAVDLESMYEYYGYCNDLLVKLNARSTRVADVSIPAVYGDEQSSIVYSTYVRNVSGMLLRNFLWRLETRYLRFDFHPVVLFYLFGAGASALGSLGVLWSFISRGRSGESLFVRVLASTQLFLIGWLFLLFAMVFDMQENEDREVVIHE